MGIPFNTALPTGKLCNMYRRALASSKINACAHLAGSSYCKHPLSLRDVCAQPQVLCLPDQVAILILSTSSRAGCGMHMQISAIVAVGAVEGLSHVNWSLYFKLVTWWYLGCIPVFFATALLNWQGVAFCHTCNVLCSEKIKESSVLFYLDKG